MSENFRPPAPGAAVVCLSGERVLLIRRGREPGKGTWSYPGGKIQAGETARAAARREALEETGLHVRVMDVVDVYDALFPPYHYCVADYLAEPEDPTAEPVPGADADEARWVPFDALSEYALTDAMWKVLDRARWLQGVRQAAPAPLGVIEAANSVSRAREALRRRVRGLYVITDSGLREGRSHVEIAWAALEGGARVIQLRDKQTDAGVLLPQAREMADLCRRLRAIFIVNDRVDLALACGADGVHLGQTDLPVTVARQMLGPDRLIGISVENVEQVRRAEAEGADYFGVGPIYGSATKHDAGDAVGTEQIARFRDVSALPIVAIGGISLERVAEVRAAGADSVAVISAVAASDDMVSTTRRLCIECELV